MEKNETLGSALRSAVAELQYAARTAGVIELDERIEYTPGSRSYGQEPKVTVRGPRGTRQFEMMPEFSSFTRAREVAVAMDTAAFMLSRFVDEGLLPASS